MVLKCITQENCHRKKSLNTYRDNLQGSHLFANEQRTHNTLVRSILCLYVYELHVHQSDIRIFLQLMNFVSVKDFQILTG